MGYFLDNQLLRLATFTDWPTKTSAVLLSANGFFFTKAPDTVKCFACSLELSNWSESDSVRERHLRGSPNCPFLAGRQPLTNGITAGQQPGSTVSPTLAGTAAAKPQNCPGEHGKKRDGSPEDRKAFSKKMKSIFSESLLNVLMQIESTLTPAPAFQQYGTYAARLKSFESAETAWPSACPTNPVDLAAAGLFYTGTADKVQCAYCRGKLYNWGRNDSPLYQHCINFPQCTFVQKIKEKKLDSVVEATNSTLTQSNAPTSFVSKLPACNSLLSKGYNAEDINEAVSHLLKTIKLPLADVQEDILQDTISNLRVMKNNGAPIARVYQQRQGQSQPIRRSPTSGAGAANNVPDQQTTDSESVVPSGRSTKDTPQLIGRGRSPPLSSSPGKAAENNTKNSASVRSAPPKKAEHGRLARLHEKLVELERENQALTVTQKCRICRTSDADTLFLPCRHLVCCTACSSDLERSGKDFCPHCGAQVLGSVKTFRS